MSKERKAGGAKVNVKVDGEKLREIRRQKALERKQLEELSGVHWVTIARMETGQKTTRLSTAKKVADALGVDPTEFVREEALNAS